MSDSFFKRDKKEESIDEELFQKVKSILAKQLEVKADKISLESKITDDLGDDSLDTVELVMALEDTLGIEIPDEDAEKILTVRQIVEYLQKIKPGNQDQKEEKTND